MLSSGVPVEHGGYQGSPLGPLLFSIYINDIVRVTTNAFCIMYADDTVIVCSDRNKDIAIKNSEIALDKVQQWCAVNKIKVDKKKTRHMLTRVGIKKMEISFVR